MSNISLFFCTPAFHILQNLLIFVFGVAMGSPLDPVLANIFMGFYKSKWLNQYNLNKTRFT